MNLNRQQFSTEIAGQKITLEVSKLAGQADSAVLGKCGETAVLATTVMGKEDRNTDYFPLVVDYEEKFYAAGKIIGSRFVRREGRPSEAAILSGRMIDRSIRPLFDKRLRRDVQIVITVLSYDEVNDPDFIALLSASTALMISQIPWGGPVAGARVAKTVDGKTIINPLNALFSDRKNIIFDSFIAGTKDRINMIELGGAEGGEAEEKDVIEGFKLAHEEIKKLVDFQKEIAEKIGKPKADVALKEPAEELKEKIISFLNGKLENIVYAKNGKEEKSGRIFELKKELKSHLEAEGIIEIGAMDTVFEEELDKLVHRNVIEFNKRPDGRKLDEIRELYAEVGLFERLHGSAIFTRGDTQSLAVVTLAAPGAEQLIETMEITARRRFMLHYNFPPYSTGEIGRMGAPGRREIGHGNLADKAVRPLIPPQEKFPYTIRAVSEILSSNGSSSMASVCAASLALMDAGVPIKKPAAGIAMGLMTSEDGKYKILTDIQGPEDHYGDMDCKVAGTKDGITAVQMDVKIDGITAEMFSEILERAKKARLQILEFVGKTLARSREKISPFAPTIMTLDIKQEQIGEVIGPGGKMIKKITKDTGVDTIDIEESGRIFVASIDREKAQMAVDYIKLITREFHIGEIIEGEVIKILDFGAIVDLGGGRDGMIHVSELKNGFVEKVEDVVKIGDKVRAKVIKLENGRIGLSIKALGK